MDEGRKEEKPFFLARILDAGQSLTMSTLSIWVDGRSTATLLIKFLASPKRSAPAPGYHSGPKTSLSCI